MEIRKYTLTLIILLIGGLYSHAQKLDIKRTKGKAKFRMESNLTEESACEKCYNRAKKIAIEQAFGNLVMVSDKMFIKTTQINGKEVETEIKFDQLSEIIPNGQWIKTIGDEEKPCTKELIDGDFWISCEVEGEVRQVKTPKHRFKIKTFDCEAVKTCETTTFYSGSSIYLSFKSPVDGYLSVFESNSEKAWRWLPYSSMPKSNEGGVKVKANQAYLLFSPQNDILTGGTYVDEYQLVTQLEREMERIYVIFSTTQFSPPVIKKGEFNETYSAFEPDYTVLEDFHIWWQAYFLVNPNFQVDYLDIMINGTD